jgi:hypothetical protein
MSRSQSNPSPPPLPKGEGAMAARLVILAPPLLWGEGRGRG